jgi:hypothetical protein
MRTARMQVAQHWMQVSSQCCTTQRGEANATTLIECTANETRRVAGIMWHVRYSSFAPSQEAAYSRNI